MVRAARAPLAGLFAVAMTTIALLPTSAGAQQSVTIVLTAQNSSGQSGTAVLTADGPATKVVIALSNAPGPHPAHIHAGACPTPGAVVFPLTAVANGRSETTVAASLSTILGEPHAINVHKSPAEIPVYTSCGDISASGAPSPSMQATPATKPAVQAPAPQASPAAKPAAQAPAQAPRPLASPAALPRTGEADPTAGLWELVAGGVALVAVGAILLAWRRRSNP